MNGILNKEINIRSKTYGDELGIKYHISYMEHQTRTQFRIFGLELLRNNIGVSIWLNIQKLTKKIIGIYFFER